MPCLRVSPGICQVRRHDNLSPLRHSEQAMRNGAYTKRRIWAYLSECAEAGRPATNRSIAKAVGLAPGSYGYVWECLNRLVDAGYVVRESILSSSYTKIRVVVPLLPLKAEPPVGISKGGLP